MAVGTNEIVDQAEPAFTQASAYSESEMISYAGKRVRFGSTGRVRKLTSSARRDSAGGTDFSCADMGEGSDGVPAFEIKLTSRPESPAVCDRLYRLCQWNRLSLPCREVL